MIVWETVWIGEVGGDDKIPEEERGRLTDLIYDDNCHLARFSLRKYLREKTC